MAGLDFSLRRRCVRNDNPRSAEDSTHGDLTVTRTLAGVLTFKGGGNSIGAFPAPSEWFSRNPRF